MNEKRAEKILQKQVSLIKPSEKDIACIEKETEKILSKLKSGVKNKKIDAQIFIGGSLAKGTLIKKKEYDIDIFIRFSEKYKDSEISDMLSSLIKAERVHGSRDYFRIKKGNVTFELIPVARVSKPENARNITDLSYFHVKYVRDKIEKKQKLAGEIMLAKSFCYSQKCYGAESYIRGFSGYALELLIINYGSFPEFLKTVSKSKGKIILDPEKFYKNNDEILNSVNEAKLSSPIIFVDPTFKERNALAALSNETFEKFKGSAKKFLKSPSMSFFKEKTINEKKFNLILETSTNRQEGDIAGSKLAKFSRFFSSKLEKYFKINSSDFDYSGKKDGKIFLKISRRKEIIFPGPPVNKPERLLSFRQAHKKVFVKNHVSFAREKPIGFSQFFSKFQKENKKVMKDMGVIKINLVKKK